MSRYDVVVPGADVAEAVIADEVAVLDGGALAFRDDAELVVAYAPHAWSVVLKEQT